MKHIRKPANDLLNEQLLACSAQCPLCGHVFHVHLVRRDFSSYRKKEKFRFLRAVSRNSRNGVYTVCVTNDGKYIYISCRENNFKVTFDGNLSLYFLFFFSAHLSLNFTTFRIFLDSRSYCNEYYSLEVYTNYSSRILPFTRYICGSICNI